MDGIFLAPLAKLLEFKLSFYPFGFPGEIVDPFAILALKLDKRFLF